MVSEAQVQGCFYLLKDSSPKIVTKIWISIIVWLLLLTTKHVNESMELYLPSISLCLESRPDYTLLIVNRARVVVDHSRATSLTSMNGYRLHLPSRNRI